MTESYEEHFAPEPDSEEFKMNTGPMKRYATRSQTNDVAKKLKMENIQQIKEKLENETSSDDEDTRNRYIKLELANKLIEIDELEAKVKSLQLIVDTMNTFNTLIDIIKNNTKLYDELIKNLNNLSYHDLVKKEIEGIKPYEEMNTNSLPVHVSAMFTSIYITMSCAEKKKAKEFHDILYYKNKMTRLAFYVESFFGVILFILYVYYYLML